MNNDWLADDELVILMKKSDEKAFRMIYGRYWKNLYLIALRKLNSKEAAEEIIQNIFTALWEKRGQTEISNLGNYLMKATRNRIINQIALLETRQRFLNSFQTNDKDNSTQAILASRELNDILQKAIELLPTKTKEIFKLSRFENFTVKEIAETMDLTEKGVEYHITNASKLLRVYLKDFYDF
jgi:RNA polymerase sigma-70 factor (family 1)